MTFEIRIRTQNVFEFVEILRMLNVALGSKIPTKTPVTLNPTANPTKLPTASHSSIVVSCSVSPVQFSKSEFIETESNVFVVIFLLPVSIIFRSLSRMV